MCSCFRSLQSTTWGCNLMILRLFRLPDYLMWFWSSSKGRLPITFGSRVKKGKTKRTNKRLGVECCMQYVPTFFRYYERGQSYCSYSDVCPYHPIGCTVRPSWRRLPRRSSTLTPRTRRHVTSRKMSRLLSAQLELQPLAPIGLSSSLHSVARSGH